MGADLRRPDKRGVAPMDRLSAKGWYYGDDALRPRETEGAKAYRRAGGQNAAASGGAVSTAPPVVIVGETFAVSGDNLLLSDTGHVVAFDSHKDAARWILDTGNRKARGQIFEVANHPSKPGAYAVSGRPARAPAQKGPQTYA
jgi:hypothetical protein